MSDFDGARPVAGSPASPGFARGFCPIFIPKGPSWLRSLDPDEHARGAASIGWGFNPESHQETAARHRLGGQLDMGQQHLFERAMNHLFPGDRARVLNAPIAEVRKWLAGDIKMPGEEPLPGKSSIFGKGPILGPPKPPTSPLNKLRRP